MGVVHFNGFETGDASGMDALASGFSVQSTTKRTGTYGLKHDGTVAVVNQTVIPTKQNIAAMYARASVLIHKIATPGSNTNAGVLQIAKQLYAGSIALVIAQINTAGVFKFFVLDSASATLYTSPALNLDQHYVIELGVEVSATVGRIAFRLDGATLYDSGPTLNTGTSNAYDLVVQGFQSTGVGDTYWDDVCVRDDGFPGVGRVIARQGLAGTPNADAFTKTSSQTAAQVWSETPFSATNEAHSTNRSQAQTMLVADVCGGTNAMSQRSIVNACKVVSIMKETGSGTAATYSQRRRIGGADTDTSQTLTSSDAAYTDGIWSATVAQLQAAEIGAVRGTDSAAVTFVSAGAEGSAASGNVTPGAPGSTATDDVLICAVHSTDQIAHSMNATYWTQIFQANGGGTTSRLSLWWGRIAAGETRDYAVTHTAGDTIIAGVVAFRGCVASGSPIHVSGAGGSGTDASMETTGVTTTVDGCMLVAAHGAGNDNAVTSVSGWTHDLEDSAGGTQNCFQTTLGTDGMVGVMHKAQTSAGAQADVTVTQGASNAWASYMFALFPGRKHVQVEDCWLMVDYSEAPRQLGSLGVGG